MRKRILSAVLMSMLGVAAFCEENKVDVSFYGFVSNQMYWQDRTEYQTSDGLLNFMPMDVKKNDIDEDMNYGWNSSMLSILTRLGCRLNGPDVLGARTMALFESDFSTASMTMFMRQAYIRFDWDRDRVTFGQTGHPMCTDLMPGTINIAIGSPFNALNRSPMLRYDHYFGEDKGLCLTGAAIYQYLSGSCAGPNGKSFKYHRNSNLPELWAALSAQAGGFSAELGFDWLQLKPRTVNPLTGHKVNEHINQWAAMLQMSYNAGKLSLRAKTTYGYNLTHLNMVSGYGVSKINADGSYEYAPLKTSSSWVFASYGRTWRAGLLFGYTKNLGADKDLVDPNDNNLFWVYSGDVRNFDSAYRICPQLEYISGSFALGLEYEITTVAYGNTIAKNGSVSDTHNVTNNRVMLTAKYSF